MVDVPLKWEEVTIDLFSSSKNWCMMNNCWDRAYFNIGTQRSCVFFDSQKSFQILTNDYFYTINICDNRFSLKQTNKQKKNLYKGRAYGGKMCLIWWNKQILGLVKRKMFRHVRGFLFVFLPLFSC